MKRSKIQLQRAWIAFVVSSLFFLVAVGMKHWTPLILGFAIGSFGWVWRE